LDLSLPKNIFETPMSFVVAIPALIPSDVSLGRVQAEAETH
jgi:hypothetical protein